MNTNARCDGLNEYKEATVGIETTLRSLIEAWERKTPLKPYLDLGRKLLDKVCELRRQGYYVVIERESREYLEIRSELEENIAFTAKEVPEGSHSSLYYELENDTALVNTKGLSSLPKRVFLECRSFHTPSDGFIIVSATLRSVGEDTATYALQIVRDEYV